MSIVPATPPAETVHLAPVGYGTVVRTFFQPDPRKLARLGCLHAVAMSDPTPATRDRFAARCFVQACADLPVPGQRPRAMRSDGALPCAALSSMSLYVGPRSPAVAGLANDRTGSQLDPLSLGNRSRPPRVAHGAVTAALVRPTTFFR